MPSAERYDHMRAELKALREKLAATPSASVAPTGDADCATCGGPAVRIHGRHTQRNGIRGIRCQCPIWWSTKV